jgi:hypothetical protein
MTKCFIDRHWPLVDYLVVDVIGVFLEMTKRGHTNWASSKPRPYDPMFFRFKPKWKPCDDIWFMTILIGRNQLLFIMDKLFMVFLELKECNVQQDR